MIASVMKISNRMSKKYAALGLSLMMAASATAQFDDEETNYGDTTSTEAGQVDLSAYLPPLQVLIDTAIARSPEVQLTDIQVKTAEYSLRQQHRDWADLVSAGGGYSVSNFNRAQFLPDAGIQPAVIQGYSVNVGVSVPLNFFIGRQDRLRSAKLQTETAEVQKDLQQRAIKEQVILTYNQLLLLQKQIAIFTEALESSYLIYDMSIERFKDGELTLDELGSSTSLKANTAFQAEQLRTQFRDTYARLERLVGVPISTLQN